MGSLVVYNNKKNGAQHIGVVIEPPDPMDPEWVRVRCPCGTAGPIRIEVVDSEGTTKMRKRLQDNKRASRLRNEQHKQERDALIRKQEEELRAFQQQQDEARATLARQHGAALLALLTRSRKAAYTK